MPEAPPAIHDAPTALRGHSLASREAVGALVAAALVLAPAGVAAASQRPPGVVPRQEMALSLSGQLAERAGRPDPQLSAPAPAPAPPRKLRATLADLRNAVRVPQFASVPDWNHRGLGAAAKRVGDVALVLFGVKPGELGGHATGGHMRGSDHYSGNAVDVMMLPYGEQKTAQGNALAEYYVEHADELDVKYIIWRGQVWYSKRGWHTYRRGGSPASRHFDHVHVSVR